jgi:DNA-binding MarR family transcriptional regulator
MPKLPPATLRALTALDAAENKRLPLADFRKASAVKTRAFFPFRERLLKAGLIADTHGSIGSSYRLELTEAGAKALADHKAATAKTGGRG